jgi:hypothetical protein
MLGTSAVIPVRQQKDEPVLHSPLLLPRRDEVVNDHLGPIRKVAELRLPDD